MIRKPKLQLDEKKERQYRPEKISAENNIIMKFVNDLNYWLRQPDLEDYSNDYVLRDLKSKYQKLLKI